VLFVDGGAAPVHEKHKKNYPLRLFAVVLDRRLYSAG